MTQRRGRPERAAPADTVLAMAQAHSPAPAWSRGDLARLAGRIVVVTGANSGVGLETARALLAAGAEVVMACRDPEKAKAALSSLPPASRQHARLAQLDLADLARVRSFAAEVGDTPLYGLVNNAAVMACPFRLSSDGLELQMATNHFGHALLTSLLLDRMAPDGRVVTVSSVASRGGSLSASSTVEDLTSPAPYQPQAVYSNTKQANLLFALELQRRLASTGRSLVSIASHPGVAATELFARQMRDSGRSFLVPLLRPAMHLVLQSAAAGAGPSLRALSDPALKGGELVGPRGFFQTRGRPEIVPVFPPGADEAAAARLFELTEEVLGQPLLP